MIVGALMEGVSMPTSRAAIGWPVENASTFYAFGLIAPLVLVLVNRYFPPKRGSLWMDWPQRLVDHFFGVGSALSFWRRLNPLFLIGIAALVQGCAGYFASVNIEAAKGALVLSNFFICAGVGFSVAACIERYVLKPNQSA